MSACELSSPTFFSLCHFCIFFFFFFVNILYLGRRSWGAICRVKVDAKREAKRMIYTNNRHLNYLDGRMEEEKKKKGTR